MAPLVEQQYDGQLPEMKRKNLLTNPPLLLQNFSEQDISDFIDAGIIERYGLGDPIMKQGELGTTACLIVSGLVSVWKEDNMIVTLGPGEFIGEMFLFKQSYRIANVIAEENTIILRFHRKTVLDYFRKKPERLFKIFTMNIINIQQRKIEAMDKKIIGLQQSLKQEKTDKGRQ